MDSEILSFFSTQTQVMLALLEDLVKKESPSSDKKAVDECSEVFLNAFRQIGLDVRTYPQCDIGDLHVITVPPLSKTGEASLPLLILTHSDTVCPVGTLARQPFKIDGPRVYGPGVLDMKAGLVTSFFAVKSFIENDLKPRRAVRIFINSAEEISHAAAFSLIRELAAESYAVLCLEPALPGGALKTRRKGRLVIRLETKGRAGHAGAPDKAVSAVDELLYQLGILSRLRSGEITMNIGRIEGGDKINVVAERASATLDIRFFTAEQRDLVDQAFRGLVPHIPGAGIHWQEESFHPPLETNPASARLIREIQNIGLDLGLFLETGQTGGGSDASIAATTGVPTVDGLGPDGAGIHAENEHVILPSLVERTALLAALLERL